MGASHEPLATHFLEKRLKKKLDKKLTVWFGFWLLTATISKKADPNTAMVKDRHTQESTKRYKEITP
jgi:hypothetical protein